MDQIREQEAFLTGARFEPTIEAPYRWRDWAGPMEGLAGDELITFINSDDALRPDGTQGPGLFTHLRSLGHDTRVTTRRDVIAAVFHGIQNRMISGNLLREVVNKVNGIQFTATKEMHTLGHLYESMLKEMRDAAGDSGEFYTPRSVVRFMVEALDLNLGEIILDPACGTGGFLVEAYNHLRTQCRSARDLQVLQNGSIRGGEAKPLPFLLAQMNLLLHGVEAPDITYGNSLDIELTSIKEENQVDVILTNPPFGGEEERDIILKFPDDRQTSDTTLLFLQVIMKRLRSGSNPGRAGIVLPNSTLSSKGIGARVKEQLLSEFNLHTIVRLPTGVFAPYTSIPTNLAFFDRSGRTEATWFYELPLPAGRKGFTKTNPLQFEEFRHCLSWWGNRAETENAWRVPVDEVVHRGYDLDIKNPHSKVEFSHLSPTEIANDIVRKERRVLELMNEVINLLAEDWK